MSPEDQAFIDKVAIEIFARDVTGDFAPGHDYQAKLAKVANQAYSEAHALFKARAEFSEKNKA